MIETTARAMFKQALWSRKARFLDAIVASIVINLLTLTTSFFAMQVYDRVVPNQAYSTLWVLLVGVIVAIVLEAILKSTRASLLDLMGKGVELELGQKFFNKALSIRMDARPNTVGTFASQIREFDLVKNFLTSSTLYILVDAPFAILFLLVIYWIGGFDVAAVSMLTLPLVLVISWLVQKPMSRLTDMHMRESSIRNGMLIETIDGAESLKATGAEGWFSQRWYKLGLLISDSAVRTRQLTAWVSHSAAAIQQVAYALTVVLGVFAISRGDISVGALIACSILVNRVLSPMTQLASMAVNWNHAKTALRSLDELMARPSEGDERKDSPAVVLEQFAGRLKIEDVQYSHMEGLPPAFSSKLFEVKPGERIAIMGPTGSGKSTLLKLLSGLYKPTQGRAFVSGVDAQLLDGKLLRKMVAYLPQDVRLFNGSLKDNLILGLIPPSDDEILRVCELTGLNRLIERHPLGIGLPIFEGGRGLSGGQRQMVALARVLLQRTKVLLLDEPSASLDVNSEQQLIDKLQTEFESFQTVVMVTHKAAMLKLVDRVVVVDNGRIVLDGPRDEVIAQLQRRPVKRVGEEAA